MYSPIIDIKATQMRSIYSLISMYYLSDGM